MASKTALVVGGSGLVGRYCLSALLEEPAYGTVISLARRQLPLAPHPKLRQEVAPLENLAATELSPIDDVFCALGTTIRKAGSQAAFRAIDYGLSIAVAEHALRFGARQFLLVSSIGADSGSRNVYLRTKGELEDALRKLPFTAIHAFRPSFLVGKREESRLGESIAIPVAKLFQFFLWGSLRRYRPIAAETVGKAMVGAAKLGQQGQFVWEFDEIKRLAKSAS